MDRGIPTEEVLQEMRQADPPVFYLVGTPRGRLTALEKDFLGLSWSQVRDSLEIKLLPREGELCVLAAATGQCRRSEACVAGNSRNSGLEPAAGTAEPGAEPGSAAASVEREGGSMETIHHPRT